MSFKNFNDELIYCLTQYSVALYSSSNYVEVGVGPTFLESYQTRSLSSTHHTLTPFIVFSHFFC